MEHPELTEAEKQLVSNILSAVVGGVVAQHPGIASHRISAPTSLRPTESEAGCVPASTQGWTSGPGITSNTTPRTTHEAAPYDDVLAGILEQELSTDLEEAEGEMILLQHLDHVPLAVNSLPKVAPQSPAAVAPDSPVAAHTSPTASNISDGFLPQPAVQFQMQPLTSQHKQSDPGLSFGDNNSRHMTDTHVADIPASSPDMPLQTKPHVLVPIKDDRDQEPKPTMTLLQQMREQLRRAQQAAAGVSATQPIGITYATITSPRATGGVASILSSSDSMPHPEPAQPSASAQQQEHYTMHQSSPSPSSSPTRPCSPDQSRQQTGSHSAHQQGSKAASQYTNDPASSSYGPDQDNPVAATLQQSTNTDRQSAGDNATSQSVVLSAAFSDLTSPPTSARTPKHSTHQHAPHGGAQDMQPSQNPSRQQVPDELVDTANSAPQHWSGPASRRQAPLNPYEVALQEMYKREMAARERMVARQKAIKAALQANELGACTFVPAVSKGTERILHRRGSPGRGDARGPGELAVKEEEEPATHERLYNNAQVMERRRQQQLREAKEQQEQVYRFMARSPGHLKNVQPRYMSPGRQSGPPHLPSGMDECTFHPRTNYTKMSQPAPDPLADMLRAFDEDDAYLSAPPPRSPGRGGLAMPRAASPGPQSAGPQRRRPASTLPSSSGAGPMARLSAELLQGMDMSGMTAGSREGPSSYGATAAFHTRHSKQQADSLPGGGKWQFSDQLDWDEFLGRQYAFLNQKLMRLELQRTAQPVQPGMSPGTMRILHSKAQSGEVYIPPPQRIGSPGRGARASSPGPDTSGRTSMSSSSVFLGAARRQHSPDPSAQHTYTPQITAKAARLRPHTVEEMVEGGRSRREARLHAARQAQEAAELAEATFRPLYHRDPYSDVRPKVDMRNPSQYLAAHHMKQQIQEERRAVARAEREALELAECTFKPQTTPLPAYLMRPHMLVQQHLSGASRYAQLQYEADMSKDGTGLVAGNSAHAQYALSYLPGRTHPRSDAGTPNQWEQYHQRMVASEGGSGSPGVYAAMSMQGVGPQDGVGEGYGDMLLASGSQPVLTPGAGMVQRSPVGDLNQYKQRLQDLQAQLMR